MKSVHPTPPIRRVRSSSPVSTSVESPKNAARARLETLRRRAVRCLRCPLNAGRRSVFGEGRPEAEVVFVGEAPGAKEEATGRPFVGAAGKVLDRALAALGLERDRVYICNTVKCRPPANRKPLPAETAACRSLLEAQLQALNPRVVVALGASAAQALLGTQEPIGRLRGRLAAWRGLPVLPTLHPASLLYQPSNRELMWEDLRMLARVLGRPAPKRSRFYPAFPPAARPPRSGVTPLIASNHR